MAFKFTCLLLACLSFPGCVTAVRQCKFYKQKCYTLTSKEQHSSLKCGHGNVLFAPNITASLTSTRSCGGSKTCTGYQVNGLVLTNNCFWRPACNIGYSNTSMILLANNSTCIGHRPHILETHFSCIKSGEIFTIGNISHSEPIRKKQGVIKSHDKFPWHFNRGLRGNIILAMEKPWVSLQITVYRADIDWEADSINIVTNDRNITVTPQNRNFVIDASQVDISLHFNRKSSIVAEGFILCFKWSKNKEYDGSDFNVCEEIQVCPRRRKSKNNKNRGHKGKGKKKKSGKRGRRQKKTSRGKRHRRRGNAKSRRSQRAKNAHKPHMNK